MASWLVRSTPEQALRVRALPGDIVLCSLLSQCLSPPRCTNGYQRIVGENLTICGGVTCDGLASCPGEVEILPAASCYRNREKLRHQWALRLPRLRFFASLYPRAFSYVPPSGFIHFKLPYAILQTIAMGTSCQLSEKVTKMGTR